MRRLFMPIVVAAFVAGCGERAVMPSSPLAPGARSNAGTPPPPPIAGDGFADLDVFSPDEGSSPAACAANTSFSFAYNYFKNGTDYNAFLHMFINGPGLDVSIHQTSNKLDGKGSITGPGFTFTI